MTNSRPVNKLCLFHLETYHKQIHIIKIEIQIDFKVNFM